MKPQKGKVAVFKTARIIASEEMFRLIGREQNHMGHFAAADGTTEKLGGWIRWWLYNKPDIFDITWNQ